MGAPSSDFSTTYTPTINRSLKTNVESGIQSQDLAGIMSQFEKMFSAGIDSQRRELDSLRDENASIRKDMKDIKFENDDNILKDGRDRDDFSVRNRQLDVTSQDNSNQFASRRRDQDLSELQMQLQYGNKSKMS